MSLTVGAERGIIAMPDFDNEDVVKRLVATGPNEGFSVRGLTGFYTEAEQLDYGVNVQGKRCGVYGESVNTLPHTARETPEPSTGVCGIGDDYGVYGKGFTKVGVYGENKASTDRGTGVYGLGVGDSIDVAGINQGKVGSSGIGVVGATEAREGVGVVGLSVDSLASTSGSVTDPPFIPKVIFDNEGKPVFGQEQLGSGTGVFGGSSSGPGVRGKSKTGPGGQFESDRDRGGVFKSGEKSVEKPVEIENVAQIRLIPHQQDTLDPALPRKGKTGDLFLVRNTATNERGRIIDITTLWLCVGQTPSHEDSDQWRQIQLAPTFKTGTL
jgi:hypothetical protein